MTLRDSLFQLTCLLLLNTVVPDARGQGAWSTEYDQPGLTGRVFGLGHWNGVLYAGGEGLQGDGAYLGSLARWDGSGWNAVPAISPYGTVRAVTEFAGELVIGGDFSGVTGTVATNIARYDGNSWAPLAGGLNGDVFALAEYQGSLYAGGRFSLAGGASSPGIARWDGSSWHPVAGGVDGVYADDVLALLSAPDGLLYVGGQFDTAGGVASTSLASWDGISWNSVAGGVSSGVTGRVRALAWYAGELHLGGGFDLPGGDNIARFDGTTFHSLGSGISDWSISTDVSSLSVFAGDLYVGGNFIGAGGVASRAVARWNGSDWSGLGGIDGSDLATTALTMTVHDGQLVVGGEFSRAGIDLSAGQAVVSHSVAVFDGSQWSAMSKGFGLDAEVQDALRWNGGVAAVGRFVEAGGSLTSQVAFFDGNDWQYLGLFNGTAHAVVEFEGDLVVAGSFDQVDGQAVSSVVRFDGQTWSSFPVGAPDEVLAVYQGQLYAGGLGGVKRWNGTAWESFTTEQPSYVLALHAHTDGKLYIGGSYSGAGNARLFMYDGTTSQPVGQGVNDMVECFVSYQGDLYVGGRFTEADGAPANILARWDGTSLTAFGGLNGFLVKSLAVFQGELYAGGDLIAFSGNPADWIARWNGSGWDALGQGLNGTPFVMVPDDTAGRLHVGGLFTKADDPGVFGAAIPSFYFAAWETGPQSLGTNYCTSTVNSSGLAARIAGDGSPVLANESVTLRAEGLPVNMPGIFFHGPDMLLVPFGNGFRCVGGQIVRGPVLASGANGTATLMVDFGGPFATSFTPGLERNFQYWFRDPQGGGAAFNLSDGLTVDFQ